MITARSNLLQVFARLAVAPLSIAVVTTVAFAAPSGFAPDAWVRGNNADTSYFGWDTFEVFGPPNFGFLYLLDDSTPELGSGITASGTRIFQGTNGAADPAPTTTGHAASSGNYYSFVDTANDTVTATAPASGAGGFTTVVMQLHSSAGGSLLDDLQFAMDNSVNTWTLHKHLNDAGPAGLGYHWIEWSAPGADLPFSIHMTSFGPHRTIDSFEIDTYWSASGPVANAISQVPEPATWVLLAGALCACGVCRNRSRFVSR